MFFIYLNEMLNWLVDTLATVRGIGMPISGRSATEVCPT